MWRSRGCVCQKHLPTPARLNKEHNSQRRLFGAFGVNVQCNYYSSPDLFTMSKENNLPSEHKVHADTDGTASDSSGLSGLYSRPDSESLSALTSIL